MMIFWILYLILSIAISYLITFFTKKRLLKAIIFSFFLTILVSVWFKKPGENTIVPIFSIFLLELSILPGNGIERIIRPMALIFCFFLPSSYLFFKKTKN